MKKNQTITANSEQLAVMKAHFPQCFDKDGRFRPDKLEDILRASGADITREGYKIDWLGKSYARLLANLKTETLLAPNADHNALPENANSENLLIQGDNLDVLKHLVNAYSEKVKMIYIDPPYNTGSDGFVYQDDRQFTVEELQRLAGVEEGEARRILDFTNSSSNSHSAWLTFMYPRLYVARELLREDGVIFISIDDNEQAQLKLLCDEVFGEENFVGNMIWKNRITTGTETNFSTDHETLIIYSRQYACCKFRGEKKDLSGYKNDDDDPKGRWKPDNPSAASGDYSFEIVNPYTGQIYTPPEGRYWAFSEKRVNEWSISGKLLFPHNAGENFLLKKYLSELKSHYNSFSSIFTKVLTSHGTKELKNLFGAASPFKYPKPTDLLKNVFFQCCGEHDLILDFFAGSGTTAHAVMALNAQDGGNRRHISVQLDEPTDPKSEARKAGYATIFDITRERIKRAAAKIQADHPDASCDFGFKEFKTIPANEGQFAGYLDDARTVEDYTPFNGMALDEDGITALLTTWAAYDGLPLHQDLESVDLDGYTAYAGGDKLYFVNTGLTVDHIVAMLTRIDDDPTFTPRKIVVFHHRFNDKELREFSEAVKAPNRKHLNLDFIQRF